MSGIKNLVIFKYRNFAFLWIGQCLSQAGTRMYQIAILWWIVSEIPSDSGTALGLFLVLGALPSILLVKIIGSVIDKTKSKVVLVSSDLLAFAVTLVVGLALDNHLLNLIMVYIAGLLIALTEAFFNPTINKAVPELVEQEHIESAVAFQSSTQYLANFGGAVMGAVLIGKLGIPMVIYLNALSYLVSAVINYIIRFRYLIPPVKEEEISAQTSGWKILEGLPVLKNILIGFGLINFFATPTLVILPLYTKATLHSDASVLGFLEASLWIGLILGNFSAGALSFVKSTVKLGSICLFVLGLGLFFPGLLINKFFYMAMLLIAGTALGINNVKFVSLFQNVVEPVIKGRFFALMNAMICFTFPVAFLLFGILADKLSPPHVCLIQGAGVMGIALYFGSLARLEHQLYQKNMKGGSGT